MLFFPQQGAPPNGGFTPTHQRREEKQNDYEAIVVEVDSLTGQLQQWAGEVSSAVAVPVELIMVVCLRHSFNAESGRDH